MSRNKDENANGTVHEEIVNDQDIVQKDGDAGQETKTQEQTYVLTQAQFDEMKARIEAITTERDEMKNLAQRVQADFDNFRRRNSSVRADSLDEGVKNAILALLPAYDSLELALSAAKEDQSPLAEGVRLVYRQFTDAFAKLGMTPIEAVGKPFDPAFHDAVMQCSEEGAESGTVVEEFKKGYMLKDKVLRHSMVKVNQ
ncbi:MAG: nucleotide exchange factor GrpE [Christensenellales bacterium]